MSKKTNPTLVGAFVIGAVALAVVSVVLFGKGEFMQKKSFSVMYFEDSIGGLDIGAPVEFGGVRIGTVVNIHLILNKEDNSIRIPVTVQIEQKRILLEGVDSFESDVQSLEDQISKGMRAQLASQSMLTGKLKIILNYFPGSEVVLHPEGTSGYKEMPTISSPLKRIAKEMEELPLREIVYDAQKAIGSVAELLGSDDARNLISNLSRTMEGLDEAIQKFSAQIDPLAGNANAAMISISGVLDEVTATVDSLDESIQGLIESLSSTAEEAGSMIHEDSPLRYEMYQTLREFSQAARSIRELAETLEQHPESLIKGKPKDER